MTDQPPAGAYALDRSLALARPAPHRFEARTSPDYGNRFGPYGGWIAALLARAILAEETHGDLLALNVSFLGGCEDGPLHGETRLLRRNRTNEFWTAAFSDARHPVAHAAATFGIRRPTLAFGDLPPPAPAPDPQEIAPRPLLPGMPGFFARYDVRQFGFKPFAVNPAAQSRMWIRDADLRPLDLVALIAHADAPIPRVFLKSTAPSPIATLSMNVYLHARPAEIAAVGGDYVLIDADCRAARDGFHDQTARLWRRDGLLLATSEQLVWFKAKE